MGQYLLMPKLDMSMEQGVIVEWLVKIGDEINKGDYFVEVETGKVSIQVDNTIASGTVLQIYANVGDTIDVNRPIMYIGKKGEPAPSDEEAASYLYQEAESRSVVMQERQFDYDLITLGGGPGGYTCAIRAAQFGKKVAIIEREQPGGVCLNKGCIPTKAFIKNAQVLQTVKNASEMGIKIDHFEVDWSEVIDRKNQVVTTMRRGIDTVFKQNKIKLIKGEGEILSEHEIKVGEEVFSAQHIVIATGSESRPTYWQSTEQVQVMTSEEVLDLQQLPKSMVICGAGVIGIELAYIFREYGVDVTLVERHDRILHKADKDITRLLERELKGTDIKILLQTKIDQVCDNSIVLDNGEKIITDMLVVVDRRQAVLPQSYKPLQLNEDDFIKTDEMMRTSIRKIFAIGDCSGKMLTAHKAIRQGNVLAENLFGEEQAMDYTTIPTCVFSYPEIAWIGMTEEEAKRRKIPIKVSKTRFSSVGKAVASAESSGLVKVIADSRWDEILGVHIIGANATDIIAQAAITMTAELCSSDIANTVFAHPTFSEAFMDACGGINKK